MNFLQPLPAGVKLIPLTMYSDERGCFTEIFREEWQIGIKPLQWNFVASCAGVLRGVHVHIKHDDYLIALKGQVIIGLRDLRINSPTKNQTALVELDGNKLKGIFIPHGVAHGFYFRTDALHIYSVSEYWNMTDELGCHWTDPDLEIPWPMQTAKVSERDANAISYKELLLQLENYQNTLYPLLQKTPLTL